MNTRNLIRSIILAAGLASFSGVLGACDDSPDSPGEAVERAGDKIEDAADTAGDKIEDAADKAEDKIDDAADRAKDAVD